MGLSVKAITLLFCCVMMTLQHRRQQSQRAAPNAEAPPSSSSSSSSSSAFSDPPFAASSGSSTAPTFYSVLQLPKSASAAQIKAAHRRLAIRFHPDKLLAAAQSSGQSPALCEESHQRFIAIQEAYEVLSDAVERKRYDFALMIGASYQRLSQSLREQRRAAEEEDEQRLTDLSALYRRKRPAAFAPTASGYKSSSQSSASASASTTASSSAASSAASTPPAASFKSSRSFSNLPSADSPAPTTASNSSRTSSPHSHSPVTSPYTPSSPSSSLFQTQHTRHAAPSCDSSTGHARPSIASLASRLGVDARDSVRGLLRWCSVLLLMFVLFPVRLFIALSILANHRRKRMEDLATAASTEAEMDADSVGKRPWHGDLGRPPETVSVR